MKVQTKIPSSRTFMLIFLITLTVLTLTGGSSRELIGLNTVVSALSAVVLLILIFRSHILYTPPANVIIALLIALTALIGLQLRPLPYGIWSSFPEGKHISSGFEALGIDQTQIKLPLSLHPQKTQLAFISFLPPALVFLALLSFRERVSEKLLIWFTPSIACLSSLIGISQLGMGGKGPLYFYKVTNIGSPVGIFSNVNHQATLLVMAIPFLALIFKKKYGSIHTAVAVIMALIIIAGVLLGKSSAGIGLLAITSLGCFISIKSKFNSRQNLNLKIWVPLTAFAIIASMLAAHWVLSYAVSIQEVTSPNSRLGMYSSALPILKEHTLFGTGLGAFEDVYRLYENKESVISSYVNHAHNDYLEWLVETGLFGGMLLLAFLTWIIVSILKIWVSSPIGSNRSLRRMAGLSILTVLLHSCVDYPLRAPTISIIAAICLALMFFDNTANEKRRKSPRKDLVL